MAKWINLLEVVYPIGSIYQSTKSVSPASIVGGTWEQITEKFLFAAGENYTCGQTGGEEKHTLSIEEMPCHFHKPSNTNFAITANNTATAPSWGASYKKPLQEILITKGGGQSHNNMPPYYVIYIWERVS